ncbi:hypothetical protein KUTeg_013491 [Tegillarca granosa]|uniref:3-hydroxyanthranilate 3,4-dioxygenase n=1 Tax=Tegillarca granosa TaxID=220873 RepID=A0ABQ9ETV2_TEGGR|nr:hypothetical protein KUTeg_013491 [Tegillarca granosa]
MTGSPIFNNTQKWLEENQKFFLPPVCNKMMHNDGQMKSFYVGGPNQRKDYHIEEGEELFYMLKGDMCLKIVEQGKHRDVPIKEGEIFLLPGKIAHSPQRQADTIGLVIERERSLDEKDGLRYYVEEDGKPTLNSLYEEWFHCVDLGTQLGPVIKRFFASEQCKTGKPIPGTIPENPPVILDSKRKVEEPFNLHKWLSENKEELHKKGCLNLFGKGYQFQVDVYGQGENTSKCDNAETFIWQLEGQSKVTVEGKEYNLKKDDNLLVRKGQTYTAVRESGSIQLICFQDPTRKAQLA